MKRWIKKSITGIIIFCVSLIVLLSAIIVAIGYIVLTPSKVTPIVEQLANEYIDADLRFSEIDITVISTFPNIGIRLNDGLLRSKANDLEALSDTIVSFDVLELEVNPIDFFVKKNVNIRNITITKPHIYAYTSLDGRSNWDITHSANTADTARTADATGFDATIALKKFIISDGRITFDDRRNKIFGRIDSLNIAVHGNMDKRSDISLDMDFRRGLFWQDGQLIIKRMALSVDLAGEYIPNEQTLTVSKASVGVNDIRIDVSGNVIAGVMDMQAAVVSPTLETVVEMIPRAYLKEADNITARGKVDISGSLKGRFLDGALPNAEINIEITDGAFRYKGFEYGIDKLDLLATAHINLDSLSDSRVHLKKLIVDGDALRLSLSADITDAVYNPTFNAQTKIDIDFVKLAKTLPLEKNTDVSGSLSFAGSVSSSLQHIERKQWAQINAVGDLSMNDLRYYDPSRKIDFTTTAARLTLDHSQKSQIKVEGSLGNVYWGMKPAFEASLQSANVSLSAKQATDSTLSLSGNIAFKGLAGSVMSDSIRCHVSASSVRLNVSQKKAILRFRSDTILLVENDDNRIQMLSAGVNLTVGRDSSIIGAVSFRNLNMRTPLFPLDINVDSTTVRVKNQRIELSKALITVGRSDMRMSGSVQNLLLDKPNTKTIIRGSLESQNLNLNQIIQAIDIGSKYGNTPAAQAQLEAAQADTSAALPLIAIPKNIDAKLTASFKKLLFGKLLIQNAQGEVFITNGQSLLRNLTVHYQGANLSSSILYAPTAPNRATATVNLAADHIDLNSLKGLTPLIDSISPMVDAIEGIVAFDLAAQAKLTNTFLPNLNDITATIELQGQNLVVLDNQTFASISKMLMFKNKDRNIIDSIHVQAILQNGTVTIFPFAIEIDRYRIAIGGTQALDYSMNYHVSVLRSPIPFKFGVNISGNFHKFKIDIVKTQYKDIFPQNGNIYRSNPQFIDARKKLSIIN